MNSQQSNVVPKMKYLTALGMNQETKNLKRLNIFQFFKRVLLQEFFYANQMSSSIDQKKLTIVLYMLFNFHNLLRNLFSLESQKYLVQPFIKRRFKIISIQFVGGCIQSKAERLAQKTKYYYWEKKRICLVV